MSEGSAGSEIFQRYLNEQVRVVSGAGVSGFTAGGALRESQGQWLVVDAGERVFIRQDLVFYIESDPPTKTSMNLPRPAGGEQ